MKEISMELSVKKTVQGIEFNVLKNYTGYSKEERDLIEEVIQDSVDYAVESFRRRLAKL